MGALNTNTLPAEGGGVSAPAQFGSGLQAPQEFNDLTAYKAKHVVDMVTLPPAPSNDAQFKWIAIEGAQLATIGAIANGASGTVGIPLGVVSKTANSGNVLTQCLVPLRYIQKKSYGYSFGLQAGDSPQVAAPNIVPWMPIITVAMGYAAAGQPLIASVKLDGDPGANPTGPATSLGGCQLVASGVGDVETDPYIPGFKVNLYNPTAAPITAGNVLVYYRILFPVPVNSI